MLEPYSSIILISMESKNWLKRRCL